MNKTAIILFVTLLLIQMSYPIVAADIRDYNVKGLAGLTNDYRNGYALFDEAKYRIFNTIYVNVELGI